MAMVSYDIQCTPQSKRVIDGLDADTRERVTDALVEMSKEREPSQHPKCGILRNDYPEKLYRIRVGKIRCIAQLDKPSLKILKVGRRDSIYEDLDELYATL